MQLGFIPQLSRRQEHALMDAAGLGLVGRHLVAQSNNSLFAFVRQRAIANWHFLADQFRSAPDIVGKGIANPCALLLAAAQMLDHLALPSEATRVRKAIRDTLTARDRVTPDLGGTGSTQLFADALIERLA